MNRLKRGLHLDTIPVMLVFLVFAVCTLFVITLGGSIYKTTVTLTNENYDEQTTLSYIWTKVRASDESGRVYVEDFNGISSLCVEEAYDSVVYKTLIYHYNGYIVELFAEEGLEFTPDAGMPIIANDSLELISLPGNVIKVTANSESLLIYPRSKAQARTE